jgi:hypothetical protein
LLNHLRNQGKAKTKIYLHIVLEEEVQAKVDVEQAKVEQAEVQEAEAVEVVEAEVEVMA